jgi:hypothetical protein
VGEGGRSGALRLGVVLLGVCAWGFAFAGFGVSCPFNTKQERRREEGMTNRCRSVTTTNYESPRTARPGCSKGLPGLGPAAPPPAASRWLPRALVMRGGEGRGAPGDAALGWLPRAFRPQEGRGRGVGATLPQPGAPAAGSPALGGPLPLRRRGRIRTARSSRPHAAGSTPTAPAAAPQSTHCRLA